MPLRSTMNRYQRANPTVLTVIFVFLGLCAVVLAVLLSRLMHLEVDCVSAARECTKSAVQVSAVSSDVVVPTSYNPPSTYSQWKLDYYGPDQSIQAYNPEKNPVFPQIRKIKVRLFTEVFGGQAVPMNECKHILYDGLSESEALDFQGVTYTLKNECKLNDWDESWKNDDLWVLDSHHVLESCDIIYTWMQKTLELRKDKEPWMILAVDYGDAHDQLYQCTNIASAAHGWYRVAKRSIGLGREWNEALQFPTRGAIAKQTVPVLHLPYPVRTDVARGIATAVQQKGLSNPLAISNRKIDVSHFYARQNNVGIKAYFDNLRNGINVILKFIDGSPLGVGGRTLTTFCGLAGNDKKRGRNVVSPQYIDIMLQSKIVVVAQRDAWSDHYRLMEALSSGAMVMADETLVLPRGLRHAESLIIFESFADFREKLLYYLRHDDVRSSVAKRGWEIAMGYHRSWHAMESVLFGQPVTTAGDAMAAFQKDLLPIKSGVV